MNRSLAVLGATKSLQNAQDLLGDSKLLFKRKRYGTSYALVIFALEEAAKGFVFHWVADGNLTETDLRKLIYNHRSKHATIHLVNFFERVAESAFSKSGSLSGSQGGLDEVGETVMKKVRQHMHLLIHAQQRREISLYIDICDRCNRELLGPWLITAEGAEELVRYTEERLAEIESLVRNCKAHESEIETQPQEPAPFRDLARWTVGFLDERAKLRCQHVLCTNAAHRSRSTRHGIGGA